MPYAVTAANLAGAVENNNTIDATAATESGGSFNSATADFATVEEERKTRVQK